MYYFKNLYIFFFFIALNLFFFFTVNASAKSFQVDEIEISEPFKEMFDKNSVIDKGFRNAFFKFTRFKYYLMEKQLKINPESEDEHD